MAVAFRFRWLIPADTVAGAVGATGRSPLPKVKPPKLQRYPDWRKACPGWCRPAPAPQPPALPKGLLPATAPRSRFGASPRLPDRLQFPTAMRLSVALQFRWFHLVGATGRSPLPNRQRCPRELNHLKRNSTVPFTTLANFSRVSPMTTTLNLNGYSHDMQVMRQMPRARPT